MKVIYLIASVLGVVLFIISPLFKKKKDILITQIGAAFCYMIVYIIKGATSGWIIEIIESIKDFIFIKIEKKGKQIPLWLLILFLGSLILTVMIFYDGPASILPLIINIAYFVSTYFKNPKFIRYTMLICAILWICYNYSVGAYVILIGNAFEIISAIYSIIKYKNKPIK